MPQAGRGGRDWRGGRGGRGWRGGRGGRGWRTVLLLVLYARCATANVIFRVPEVLVRHAAASKPVGTGPANATRINESERWSEPEVEVRYEEYFVEHDVSTKDARKAAKALDVDSMPSSPEGCGVCTRQEMEYCETRVLADHCCCERRFLKEPFPWLPHTCYLGPHRCKPIANDCVRYTKIRDCCCYKKLAERWKAILLSSSSRASVGAIMLVSALLLFAFL